MNPDVTTKRCPDCGCISEWGNMMRPAESVPHADLRECVRALRDRLAEMEDVIRTIKGDQE